MAVSPSPLSEELAEIKALKIDVRDLTESNEMAVSRGQRKGPVIMQVR